MLVNEYKLEFYVRNLVGNLQNLDNVYICGAPFVMTRTDAQNGQFTFFSHITFTQMLQTPLQILLRSSAVHISKIHTLVCKQSL